LALVEGVDVAVTMLYDKVDDEFLDAAGTGLRGVCNVAVGSTTSTSPPARGAASSSPTRPVSSTTPPPTSPSP
jgi:hypothetical protein